jgi:hypothetical protein
MKRLPALCLLALACTLGTTAFAQLKRFSYGPYAELAFPTGKMSDIATTGYGAGLSLDVELPAQFGATASVGLMHFGGRTLPGTSFAYPATNVIPLRIGAKYRFSKVYAALESGVAIGTSKGAGSTGILAPAIGVRFIKVDIRAKYETWFQSGATQFWALQAALRF